MVLAATLRTSYSIIAQNFQKGKRLEENNTEQKKKKGRPTVSPLIHDLKVRLDEDTHRRLENLCNRTGKGKAEVVRAIVKDFLKDK